MRIRELIATGQPCISFEFFPPKSSAGFQELCNALVQLQPLKPSFVSVTYGAGGTTRRRTLDLVTHLRDDYGIEAMAHLTCVGASRDEIHSILARLQDAGVENILALRGDPPRGETEFVPHEHGFKYGDELVAYANEHFDFCIGGACYPECHVEAENFDLDLDNLRRKVDAGCQFLVTQLFFDNNKYFDFVNRARAKGIGVPIVPGIMPITNVAQIERFTKMCGATIPETLHREFKKLQDDPQAVLSLGVAYATAQVLELLQNGAPGLHLYTLNKSPATRTILIALQAAYPATRRPAGF